MPSFRIRIHRGPGSLVPHVGLMFWSFRVMVGLGVYFVAFFAVVLFLGWKKQLRGFNWLHWLAVWSIPLAYIASEAGWIVAEVRHQPWTNQDMLPVGAAISVWKPVQYRPPSLSS